MKETNYKELSERLEQEVWDLQDEVEMYENINNQQQLEISKLKETIKEKNKEYKSLEETNIWLENEVDNLQERVKLEMIIADERCSRLDDIIDNYTEALQSEEDYNDRLKKKIEEQNEIIKNKEDNINTLIEMLLEFSKEDDITTLMNKISKFM